METMAKVQSFLGNLKGGDQVLFQGADDFGNVGGISYIVDNGASNQTPSTLLTKKQLSCFFDYTTAAPDVGGLSGRSDYRHLPENSANCPATLVARFSETR